MIQVIHIPIPKKENNSTVSTNVGMQSKARPASGLPQQVNADGQLTIICAPGVRNPPAERKTSHRFPQGNTTPLLIREMGFHMLALELKSKHRLSSPQSTVEATLNKRPTAAPPPSHGTRLHFDCDRRLLLWPSFPSFKVILSSGLPPGAFFCLPP